jgi:hypothetical protein
MDWQDQILNTTYADLILSKPMNKPSMSMNWNNAEIELLNARRRGRIPANEMAEYIAIMAYLKDRRTAGDAMSQQVRQRAVALYQSLFDRYHYLLNRQIG